MDRINNTQQAQYSQNRQTTAFDNEPQTEWIQYVDLHDEPNTFGSTSRPDTP